MIKPRYAQLLSILIFTAAGLMSCNTMPLSNNESWYTYEKDKRREKRSIGTIKLIGVTVYRSGGWDSIQSEIKGLAALLFWKHGLYLVSDNAEADYAADIRIHEREYMSQWRTKRSLALELRIWELTDEIRGDIGAPGFSFDDRLPVAAGRVIGSGNYSFSSSQNTAHILPYAVKNAVKRLDSLHSLKSREKNREKKAAEKKASEKKTKKETVTKPKAKPGKGDEIEYQADDE